MIKYVVDSKADFESEVSPYTRLVRCAMLEISSVRTWYKITSQTGDSEAHTHQELCRL
jgi:hypothetical protein